MIRGYIAVSADGFVADRMGGVGWLDAFSDVDYGYQDFIDSISTVVLGRTTYEQILSFGRGWPYPKKNGIVLTSRPLETSFPEIVTWVGGVGALSSHLRDRVGDSWIVGGAQLQAGFIERRALDRLDLFVIPVLLGGGVPLHKSDAGPVELDLLETETYDKGIVRHSYRLSPDMQAAGG